jgi:hypothetical protein
MEDSLIALQRSSHFLTRNYYVSNGDAGYVEFTVGDHRATVDSRWTCKETNGEDRIRTCGPVLPSRIISNDVLSTTQPPLQMVKSTGDYCYQLVLPAN